MSRELFNETPRARETSSLLQGCAVQMRETRQIAALTLRAGRHPMQEVATAPVGASLSRELFNETPRAREQARSYRVVQCRCGRQGRSQPSPSAPEGTPCRSCNCTCRSELARELLQGLCSRVGVSLCAFCSSTRPRPGSGRRTGSIRQRWRPCPPDAPPG